MFPSVPLEQVRVKGEEAVQRIGVSRHRVAPYGAPDDGQRVAVVALHDGVAEDELVSYSGSFSLTSSGRCKIC